MKYFNRVLAYLLVLTLILGNVLIFTPQEVNAASRFTMSTSSLSVNSNTFKSVTFKVKKVYACRMKYRFKNNTDLNGHKIAEEKHTVINNGKNYTYKFKVKGITGREGRPTLVVKFRYRTKKSSKWKTKTKECRVVVNGGSVIKNTNIKVSCGSLDSPTSISVSDTTSKNIKVKFTNVPTYKKDGQTRYLCKLNYKLSTKGSTIITKTGSNTYTDTYTLSVKASKKIKSSTELSLICKYRKSIATKWLSRTIRLTIYCNESGKDSGSSGEVEDDEGLTEQVQIEEHKHVFEEVSRTEPTCEKDGEIVNRCKSTVCNHYTETTVLPKLHHLGYTFDVDTSEGGGGDTKADIKVGYTYQYCYRCNAIHVIAKKTNEGNTEELLDNEEGDLVATALIFNYNGDPVIYVGDEKYTNTTFRTKIIDNSDYQTMNIGFIYYDVTKMAKNLTITDQKEDVYTPITEIKSIGISSVSEDIRSRMSNLFKTYSLNDEDDMNYIFDELTKISKDAEYENKKDDKK